MRPITCQAATQDSRVELTVVCCMDLFCEIYPKQVVSLVKAGSVPANLRELSPGHEDTTALTQQLPLYSAKRASRHLLFRVQVDAMSSVTKVLKNISSCQRARFVAPFDQSVARHDWTQLHVFNDTRITGRATYTRERYIATIVELALILLHVRSTMFTWHQVQHRRTVVKGSQIAY